MCLNKCICTITKWTFWLSMAIRSKLYFFNFFVSHVNSLSCTFFRTVAGNKMQLNNTIVNIFCTFFIAILSFLTGYHLAYKWVEIPLTSYVRWGCSHRFHRVSLPHPELTASPRACALPQDRCKCSCTGNNVCLVEINSTEDGVWITCPGHGHPGVCGDLLDEQASEIWSNFFPEFFFFTFIYFFYVFRFSGVKTIKLISF